MSKKLTFKSVAISAVIALGMTGMIGVSASAAPSGTVTLAPTTGTEYFVTAGASSDFDLTSTNTTDAIGTTGLLKWRIVAPTTVDADGIRVDSSSLPSTESVGSGSSTTGTTNTTATLPAGVWYQNDNIVNLFLAAASTKVAVGSEITVSRYVATRFGENESGETDDIARALYKTETVRVTAVSNNLVTFTTDGPQDTVSSVAIPNLAAGDDRRQGEGYTISYGNTTDNTYAVNGSDARVIIVNSRHNAASFAKNLTIEQISSVTDRTTRSVVVTAWLDRNNDGIINADEETVSPARTITFINPASVTLDATAGFTFAGARANATTVTSSIKTNPVLNQDQSAIVPRTLFTSQRYNANVLGVIDSFWGSTGRSTADASVITSTSDTQSAFVAGFYTARPYLTATSSVSGVPGLGGQNNTVGTYNLSANPAVTWALGAAVSTTLAADRIAGLYATVAGSNNTSPATSASAGSAASSLVRLGTAAVDVKVLAVSETVLDTPAGAGKTVVATISDSTAFKLNGGNGPVTLTTNAAGEVTVSVSKVAPATAGGPVTITFTSTDVDDNNNTVTAVLEWVAASYTLYNLNDTRTDGIAPEFSIKANESISFAIALHDQWRVPAPTATYRVTAAVSGTGVNVTTNGALAWSGNTANLTLANNGTTGNDVIEVAFAYQVATAGVFGSNSGTQNIDVTVVPANLTYVAEVVAVNSDLVDDIQNTHAVRSLDSRSSQLARSAYDSNYVYVQAVVRDAATGLPRPWAKVNISGPADFMFTASDSVDRLGSLSAISNESGVVFFYVMSNRSVVDAVITVTADGGTGKTAKVTFEAPNENYAEKFQISAPKSIKAGRTMTATVSVVDKWGNAVSSEGITEYGADTELSAFSNRGLLVIGNPLGQDVGLSIYQVKILLQPLDRGPVVVNLDWKEDDSSSGERVTGSFAVWSGPAVNATAGAKKGRVVVEAYRAVGKTVDVFVGSTKVATFTPDVANDRFVVRGVKSGTRNVSVRIVGPGYDFPRTAITVK